MVCMRVIHPLMKKMVPMTAARSSGVPAGMFHSLITYAVFGGGQ